MIDLDLTFDALGFPAHLPNFITLIKRYSEMRVVYDHCMKPQIREQRRGIDAFSEWSDGISQLAADTSGYIKFSGLVTEADDGWRLEDLRPFAQHVLSTFGPDRVMWGSDWPVCRLQSEYADWHQTAQELTQHLSDAERSQIFGGTAQRFYRLAEVS